MRKKTAPRTRKHQATSSSKKLGLIAGEKNAQQSAKTKSALDNRFHRTALLFTCGPRSGPSGATACYAGRIHILSATTSRNEKGDLTYGSLQFSDKRGSLP